MNIAALIDTLQDRLEDAQDERNRLSERMAQNQQLATSEERLNDGFSIIYSDLEQARYRVEKLREAIAALRAIQS